MAEPLSPESYAAAGGRCCPYCGSPPRRFGSLRVHGPLVVVPMACLACLARWRAVYELAGYEKDEKEEERVC